MIDIDHLYDNVTKDSLSTKELENIIALVDQGTSFKNSSFTSTDLYIKISKDKNCSEDLIIKMIISQFDNYRSDNKIIHVVNSGTKVTFDTLWNDSINEMGGRYLKLVLSKHADAEQIEFVWNKNIKGTNKNVDKNWLNTLKNSLMRHPNFPTKIMNRQLRNKESLLNIALNPNLSGKAFEQVCLYAKVQRHDGIFENLTRNKGLDWKTIADGIDLKDQLISFVGKGIPMSARRQAAIFEFFRRKDVTEKALSVFYEITGEEEFLPQSAKDIFLF